MEKKNKYKNDTKWADMAAWGKDIGLSTWGAEVVCMKSINTNLFMGSRLSAQSVIDKGKLVDQDKKRYDAKHFHLVCVASDSTCQYCEISNKYKNYDMKDKHHENDLFLETAIKTADHIHNQLKWGRKVMVHCHSGRNRAALAVIVYCARYTDYTYNDALYQIRLLNSSRFPMQSTLQNNSFTSTVREKWDTIKKQKSSLFSSKPLMIS